MKLSSEITPKLTPSLFSLQCINTYDTEFFSPDSLSIVFINSGFGSGKINGESFNFTAPSIICINESEYLKITKSSNLQGKVLSFSPSLVRDYFTFDNLRNYDHSFTPHDINLVIYFSIFFQRFPNYTGYLSISDPVMKKFNKLLDEIPKYSERCIPDILIEILASIKRIVQTSMSISNVIITETSFEIKDVLMYLHDNCKQKITIPKLSKQFHVNRTTLSDKFFEATGETIITYLNKYRINLAAIMLRESTYSISNIAEEVGFNDTAYFAKLFKKYMFHTPSGYRQRYFALFQAYKEESTTEEPANL